MSFRARLRAIRERRRHEGPVLTWVALGPTPGQHAVVQRQYVGREGRGLRPFVYLTIRAWSPCDPPREPVRETSVLLRRRRLRRGQPSLVEHFQLLAREWAYCGVSWVEPHREYLQVPGCGDSWWPAALQPPARGTTCDVDELREHTYVGSVDDGDELLGLAAAGLQACLRGVFPWPASDECDIRADLDNVEVSMRPFAPNPRLPRGDAA